MVGIDGDLFGARLNRLGRISAPALRNPLLPDVPLRFYTGVRARFTLGGQYWKDDCPPDTEAADLVVTFDEILATTGSTG